jgi:hypothetical protein
MRKKIRQINFRFLSFTVFQGPDSVQKKFILAQKSKEKKKYLTGICATVPCVTYGTVAHVCMGTVPGTSEYISILNT